MDWPADDQPFWLQTRAGPILSVPYPAELNDSASIIHRENSAREFGDMIVDQFDEMVEQCARAAAGDDDLAASVRGRPAVPAAGAARRSSTAWGAQTRPVWWTTPGAVADFCYALPPGTIPGAGP